MPLSLDQLMSCVMEPELESRVHEAITSSNLEIPPGATDRTIEWFNALRGDLVNLMREVEDEMQMEETLAVNYVELKSRWIAINTKVNYQVFRTGLFDPETAMRGTAASMLLGEIERLLDPKDIAAIAEFLAQPLRRAA